jgi:hypothetical protein
VAPEKSEEKVPHGVARLGNLIVTIHARKQNQFLFKHQQSSANLH